jgi:hypothetical protein
VRQNLLLGVTATCVRALMMSNISFKSPFKTEFIYGIFEKLAYSVTEIRFIKDFDAIASVPNMETRGFVF